ncbi:MAG: sugar transferase [Rhodospirillales bacterium]|nr:sugar transferase [Rhodospirillales bacterium]
MLIIAVAIKLDSRGPVFFRHERIGEGGRRFTMLKFRTLKRNADRILRRFLKRHPELQEEWGRTHKLKDDPRLTRVGWLLRRTSLDELPQIFNVLRGQMSLVGPRPIIDEEVDKYGRSFNMILKVKPGITGLWQVSGRNNLTYDERVQLDVYYVRNWSVWLDVYLLSRTALAVMLCRGAY